MGGLNDQQRAQLLQLYKSKLQQLGDDTFFDKFDEIREECYKQIGVAPEHTFWKPSSVKVNNWYVWRVERQTGSNPVVDYEWALDSQGHPFEFQDEQSATNKAKELNSQSMAGARLGQKGGRAKSAFKVVASRENGRKGGRPKSKQSIDMEDI